MWQRVTADDAALARKAFDVLDVYKWLGTEEQWAEALREQQIYYYQGPNYELVGGFRFHPKENEWRIEMSSIAGTFSDDVTKNGAQLIVDFMNQQKVKSLFMVTPKRADTDPIEVMYRALGTATRQHPAVLDVIEETLGLDSRWSFVLK